MMLPLSGFIRIADRTNQAIGDALSWFLPLMTAITLAVIILGSVFRVGWVWLGELVVYMHACLFMLAAADTLRHDGHVRIDVFYDRFSPMTRAWVNLIGVFLLLLPTCTVIIAYSIPYVAASWEVLEHSPEGQGLPAVFLLKTCIPLGAVLLIIEGLALAAKSLLTIVAPRD